MGLQKSKNAKTKILNQTVRMLSSFGDMCNDTVSDDGMPLSRLFNALNRDNIEYLQIRVCG